MTQREEITTQQYNQVFEEEYKRLNSRQKQAVDQIYGPVMVIAGPGTGKTQILAMRIAKILQKTDAGAHNILCLTFTEAGTIAMRKRLLKIIGPSAHHAHIFTFHGFCNQVIQENPDIFGQYRVLEPLSDLEKAEIYEEIIDQLPPDHLLKRLKTDASYEAKRLDNLFNLMKKEHLWPSKMLHCIDEFVTLQEDPEHNPDMFYKRKYKNFNAGERKPKAFEKFYRQIEETKAAVALFDQYQALLQEKGRYDYNDMLWWVLEAFEKDENLLLHYQERYQFFLVDEFQDTNGTQKALLVKLLSFWQDKPDVFVVGDDDQAIYKFQGANLSNIHEMYQQYPATQMVVLENNYRSSQLILNGAQYLIEQNTERMVNTSSDLSKNLHASLQGIATLPHKPTVKEYDNIVAEQAAITDFLYQKFLDGADLSEYAVITRTTKEPKAIIAVLEKRGVPINVRRRVNILELPITNILLSILEYLALETDQLNSGDHLLFKIMHYQFWGISSRDIGLVALYQRNNETEKYLPFRAIISSEAHLQKAEVSAPQKLLALSEVIDQWVKDVMGETLQTLFENILNKGKILQYILRQEDKTWLLEVVSTLFDHLKDATKKNPLLSLPEYLAILEKMRTHNIEMPIHRVSFSTKGINFLTAHGSKGLEFDHVLIPGVTKDKWDKSGSNRNHYLYPTTINENSQTTEEDERRLLYVAMTRARKTLEISYATAKPDGKQLIQSQFVDEILQSGAVEHTQAEVTAEMVSLFQYDQLLKLEKKPVLLDHDKIDRVLQNYKLSVTGLNKYLQCPVTFYFETILRIPTARSKYMGFGRAIHAALENYYKLLNEEKQATPEEVYRFFEHSMEKHRSHFTETDFQNFLDYGKIIIPKYYTHALQNVQPDTKYALEVAIKHADYQGIPIKGILDKVEITKNQITVVDFKTGKHKKTRTRSKLRPPNERNPDGGDYWRQIIFYKLLLESDKQYNWDMTVGIMDFVEPDPKTGEFHAEKYVIRPDEIAQVGEQIQSAWTKIQNHEFEDGCHEEDCPWCQFVENDFVFVEDSPSNEDVEPTDEDMD